MHCIKSRPRLPRRHGLYRRVHSKAASVQTRPHLPEPGPEDTIALESVDIVPLPSPVTERVPQKPDTGSVTLVDLPTALSKEEEPAPANIFSLDKTQSLWLLNVVSFLYGTNTTFVKDTIEDSHLYPTTICALRYSLASVLLLPLLLGPGVKKVNLNLSFELGLALFAAYQCQARELVTESASEGSIMLAVYLLLVPVIELLFGRPFTRKKTISLAVAMGGVALLAAGGGTQELASESVRSYFGVKEGTLWGLASAISFAVHLVRSELRQHEAEDIGQLAASQLIVCGILSLLLLGVNAAFDPRVASELSPSVIAAQMPWIPFIITVLFGTVIGQSGELIAVAKVPASSASLTLSLVVVWGLFCGALINHDQLTPVSWAGAALIISATIIPKVLDVVSDRSGGSIAVEEVVQPPPMLMTSEEMVRTTVSASMLAATPVMVEGGMLATHGAVATSTMVATETLVLSAEAAAAVAGASATGSTAAMTAATAAGGLAAEGIATSQALAGAGAAAGAIAGAANTVAGSTAASTAAATTAAASTAAATTAAASTAAATTAAASTAAATTAAAASTAAATTAAATTAAATTTAATTAAATTAAATTAAATTAAASTAAAGTAAASTVAGVAAAAAVAGVAAGAGAGGDVAGVINGAVSVVTDAANSMSTVISDATPDSIGAAANAIDGLRESGLGSDAGDAGSIGQDVGGSVVEAVRAVGERWSEAAGVAQPDSAQAAKVAVEAEADSSGAVAGMLKGAAQVLTDIVGGSSSGTFP